ncbi:MAG TPA: DUF3536 domain-containing protein [Pyrinomonadaceae bacterium]|nr:DUF3536 domain-containing protein [Pyrinomonadaceae bacterium]
MKTALVIHGHFYQPPRENPWTGNIDREPSAHPYHDWNERIHRECYRPNGFARIIDGYGRIERIVNNYASISFNFGPTLLSWLELRHSETYARLLEADRESLIRHGGHGNAIAQAYHHTILPLSPRRDQQTQMRWGIADFRYRFGREPEALWLPETACNDETLGLLIDEGLRYVILSPHQAERVRAIPDGEWRSVADGTIDTTLPYTYLHRDGSGRSIAIFFYDGPIAKAIAFEGALASSQGLVDRFERASRGAARIVNVATDGETYGHHFHWGDRTLAYALEVEAPSRGFRPTNYGEYLDQQTPSQEVEIKRGPDDEGAAWSCAHGVGRWRRDCGCQAGALEGWNQAWREPLRRAFDFLRDAAELHFEATRGDLFLNPWAARDQYVELILDQHRSRDEFVSRQAGRLLPAPERSRALAYLELQRNAMLMYTSCGWFFADISGIEAVQVLKYAGRVLDLMNELELESPREQFLDILAEARSNVPKMGSGADVFRRFVDPCKVTPRGIAANLALSSLVIDSQEAGRTSGYLFRVRHLQKQQHGRITLATGHLLLEEVMTGRQFEYAIATMHFGGIDFYCVMKPFPGEESFQRSAERLWTSFRTASLPIMLRIAQEEFGPDEYGLEHVLPRGRQRISGIVFGNLVRRFSEQYAHLYEDNRRLVEMLQEAGFDLPAELRAAAEFTLSRRFEEEIRQQRQSRNPADYQRAREIAREVERHGYQINRSDANRLFEGMIADAVRSAIAHPSQEGFESALSLLKLSQQLDLNVNLEQAQETVYQALKDGNPSISGIHDLALMLGLSPSLLRHAPSLGPSETRAPTGEVTLP